MVRGEGRREGVRVRERTKRIDIKRKEEKSEGGEED